MNIMILTMTLRFFSTFQSQDGTAARVMKDEEGDWGFYLPYYQKWVEV